MMVAATTGQRYKHRRGDRRKSIAAKFMLLARHMSVEATPAPVGHP